MSNTPNSNHETSTGQASNVQNLKQAAKAQRPLIGKPMDRVDGHAKVTGHAKYAGDYKEAHLAHAVVFESSIAHGTIKKFDLAEAKKVPGVIDIITFENAPKLHKPSSQSGGGSLGEHTLPLSDNEVRYNGQFIGAVIAETLEAAQQAARLVKVTYREEKPMLDLAQLRDKSKPLPKMEGMGKIDGERGNSKKALKNAAVTLQETYQTPIENHNPMEPSGTLATWKDGQLVVYDATQGVSTCADLLGQAWGTKNVQVIAKNIGGGFGCKGSVWNHQLIALMAAKKTGRPVKLILTRQQMFTGVGHRAQTIQKIGLGTESSGKLSSIEHICLNNTATDKDYSERSAVFTQMLYQCDNVTAQHRVVKLNYQAPTFMRAPGECSGSAALESAMDELAIKLKMDPIEFRLQNYAEKDQSKKKPYSSKSLKECYEKGAAKFGWHRRHPEPRLQREGDDWVGYGMATATYPANRFAAKASIELSADGRAKVRSATQDIGTGSWTIFTQIAADGLALPVSSIDLDIGDSQFPKSGVSGGSSTASSVGSAIERACTALKTELAQLATADAQSPLHGLDEKGFVFKEGRISSMANIAQSESYGEILKRAKKDKLASEGSTKQERSETPEYSTHAFGAQFAEVRVNAFTGEVRVTKMTGAFACGRILNEKTAASQFMGGMIFALGQGLMEETRPDLRTGRLAVKDLADYHLPVNADVPDIELIMVEEDDPHVNPIGTKGIGEIGVVGMAAAIANAVYNACGVRVRDFPLTPDKIASQLGPMTYQKA